MNQMTLGSRSNWKRGLFDVLDLRRSITERALRKNRCHEWIEIAVEHVGRCRRGHASAEVLYHLIRLQHVRANLVAPADVSLRRLIGDGLLLALLQFDFVEL